MNLEVTITEKATGKQAVRYIKDYKFGLETIEFYYYEGNGSCNCNLAQEFDGDENNDCDGPREFSAIVKQIA